MIMSTTPTFSSVLMAVKSITEVNQLRGKAGGVNRFGSNTDFGLRLVLRKNVIDPDKDIKLIQVGGTAQMVAAISRGLIQFALFNEPFIREAEKFGFKTLIDVPSQKIPSLERRPDQGDGAQSSTAGFFPPDLGADRSHLCVQNRKRVDQGADRQVFESKRCRQPRTGLRQLENDST